MSLDSNKELIRRLFRDVLNRAQPQAIDQIVSDNYAEQDPFPGQAAGRAGVAQRLAALFLAFPDLTYQLLDLIAENDQVVARWTMQGTQRGEFVGVPATNKSVTLSGVDIYTIQNNQIVSHSNEVNLYSFLVQVDALPKA